MKKTASCTIAAALLFACTLQAAELTGREIVEKVKESNRSTTGVVTKGTLVLKNEKNGQSENRTVVVLAKTGSDELRKSLFRFTSGSQKGTTFLSQENKGSDNTQYVYLKSVGKPRQVESSDKEKNFVDTDLSYESMGGMKLDDYTYKRLPDATFQGRECYVVENLPKKSDSNYSKHVIMTDKEYLIPLATKSYNKAGRLVKQSIVNPESIKTLRKGLYIPTQMVVKDLEARHTTMMNVSYVQEEAISESIYNKNKMSDTWAQE